MGNIVASKAFLPPAPSYDKSLHGISFVTSSTGDKVPIVFHRRTNAEFTFLFSHGNAEDIGQMQDWMIYLSRQLNVNILSYDYRGYGTRIHQLPDEASTYADIEAAYNYLVW
eukprot:CAMPEP_0174254168 /NCGR_PEP_ID=MMETSP0439-20130205/3515_1 /TAXON_ID=0 /ORGANISM="Stereomyxa ramosa, Strain Chinc5" /LENGTH=111 /DNA_ID=CAMNT_0015335611 /DNA_START=106 /DNA_END=438 /DNA_ORIENTATION=-